MLDPGFRMGGSVERREKKEEICDEKCKFERMQLRRN